MKKCDILDKNEIRKKHKELREKLSQSDIDLLSKKISENLMKSWEFEEAKTVLIYVSKDREVQTEDLIKEALFLDKKVAVPITENYNRILVLSEIKHLERETEKRTFNINEPKKEYLRQIFPESVDLFVLPGLAFDRQGNRLGYGHGYFDRLLENARYDAHIFALSYGFQILGDRLPSESHDIPVQKVFTEVEVIDCR